MSLVFGDLLFFLLLIGMNDVLASSSTIQPTIKPSTYSPVTRIPTPSPTVNIAPNRRLLGKKGKNKQTTSSPTSYPVVSPTSFPTKQPTDLCSEKCDIFGVEVSEMSVDSDGVNVWYRVYRRLSDGSCRKPIKFFTLGICDMDQNNPFVNAHFLDSIIADFDIINKDGRQFKMHRSINESDDDLVFGTDTDGRFLGIRFNVDIEQEMRFKLSLSFDFPDSLDFGNSVRINRGNAGFECNEVFLSSLPCFSGSRSDAALSQSNKINIEIDPYIFWTFMSWLLVCMVLLIFCGCFYVIRQWKARSFDDNEEEESDIQSRPPVQMLSFPRNMSSDESDNEVEEGTNKIHSDECLEDQQLVNKVLANIVDLDYAD